MKCFYNVLKQAGTHTISLPHFHRCQLGRRGWPAFLCMLLALILNACSVVPQRAQTTSSPKPVENTDGGPLTPVDLSHVLEPAPRKESYSRYGNKPYAVFGQRYQVRPTHKNYIERGLASWYGRKFHGLPTSSREPYNMYAMTAAHRSLPIPCYAEVTNLENGRSVVVRVNDRGPFHANRIIDLSYAAAHKLGVTSRGTAMVEVRAINAEEYRKKTVPTSVNSMKSLRLMPSKGTIKPLS